MSGGSWDYLCYKMEDAGGRLRTSQTPDRKAFGVLMLKCAKAMHDIEWVDSCDMARGDEMAAIKAALGGTSTRELIDEYRTETRELLDRLDAMAREGRKQ